MKTAAETEKEFDNFMAQLAFTRVSHDVGASPNFKNADYVNKYKNIIIELKVLEKEFFPSGGVIDSLNSFIIQPVDIDDRGIGQYKFTLPNKNREGKHDNFEEPLRRIIKKANTQIRETKNHYFGSEPALGFVILAQTGLQSLSANVTAQVVRKILNQEFSSID
ncbi:MAG: hypothetical protein P8P74_02325 [Crocinitomicaceae bacterium]|nr:hypothetical protein [Crocinitomicaceae bacterium]